MYVPYTDTFDQSYRYSIYPKDTYCASHKNELVKNIDSTGFSR